VQSGETFGLLLPRQVGDDVLDHHDGGVDQHADRDGQAAQAHQVGGHPHLVHENEGQEGGQRQDQGHGHRRP
jgi:hypothetical protein